MTAPAPTTFSRVAALRAIRAGRDAARSGDPVTACPYSQAGSPTERALARYWIRGYSRENPPTVAT